MSADHLQFLKNKFILDLEEAEEEHSGENEIPFSRFQQIRDALKAKDITASTPIRLKNCIYNAISALEECVVLSEKREPRKKKDGPMHGYTLAEHWILCKTRKLLVQKRKLTDPADAIIPEEGFQEIGIVGLGDRVKPLWPNWYFRDYRIWICLFRKLSGNVRFKKMIKDMLKQCKAVVDDEDFDATAVDDEDYDGVEVEELLENLGKALKGKRYLMVLDGIWDINIHWYFKLKEKLKSLTGDGDGHVIITSRLHKARMMPPLNSMEDMRQFRVTLRLLGRYKLKLKDEVVEQCDGLPLAMHTLAPIIDDQILGKE
ncbi:hypothetical protein AAG906_039589 [Vitis piasezkii]